MDTQTQKEEKYTGSRYGRPQNIRVVLSSYLAELREVRFEKKTTTAAR